MARQLEIERELFELARQRRQIRFGLPIGGMVAGLSGAALLASMAAEAVDDERPVGTLRLGLSIGAAAMLGLGVASYAWLRSRNNRRREIQGRTSALQLELSTLIASAGSGPHARTRRERVGELDSQLARLRGEYAQYGLTGPVVVMSVGFGLAVQLLGVALIASKVGDDATLFVASAGLSAAVGIGGAVWFGQRKRARRPLSDRIRALEGEKRSLVPLSFDLQLHPERALLTFKVQF